MIKISYILISKEIILATKYKKNRIAIFSYFAFKRGLDDTVGFSLDNIVEWCGYKVNYRKDKTNDNFAKIIKDFENGEYITTAGDITRNNYIQAKVNSDKFDLDSQFAIIYLDEIEKLKNFKDFIDPDKKNGKMSTSILLLLLSYIRLNMLRREKKYFGDKSNKPEFCFRMYKDIENDIGISSRYISKAVSILEELNLIVTRTISRTKDENDNWHTGVTLFANKYKRIDGGESIDAGYDCEQELQWGYEYIKEKKYLSKKFNQNTETK